MNLSKLGSFLKRVGKIAPTLLLLTPLAPIADEITAAIQEAEAIPSATGPEKLQHVINIAITAATAVNAQAGRSLIPLDRVVSIATLIVNLIISATNQTHAVAA